MKSILMRIEKEMPKTCRDCYNNNVNHHCEYRFHEDGRDKRHSACPLQDTSELLEALEELSDIQIYVAGHRVNEVGTTDQYNKLYNALGGNIDE